MSRPFMLYAYFAALLIAAFASLNCGSALTGADQQKITDDAAKIAACQSAGLACQNSEAAAPPGGCYGVYDRCMQDAGLRQ